MTMPYIAFFLLVFLAVSGLVYGLIRYFAAPPGLERLEAIDKPTGSAAAMSPWHTVSDRLRHFLEPLARLSVPDEKWEDSPLRTRFLNAGFRGNAAPLVYFAAKTIGAFLVPALFAAFMGLGNLKLDGASLLAFMLLLAAIGYYLPNAILARLIARRKRELFENFPDALDLMRICVEAGLGLDAAIARVGEEMRLKSETLYEELHLVSLELRAGAARDRALRNLALRMGLEEMDSLAAMLIQAERFGTSVSASLRVHAEGLRSRRRSLAEETAAKVPVKLLFPLVFCIFPSLLLVLLGPAIIAITKVLLPTLAGH
ncbi:MAG: type II secretion system F family protein [Burkholderiales bacterium]|nr:type II secretion system F family protein [Burkholderiales bacterium]